MKKKVFKDYKDLSEYMYMKANDGINITATLFFEDATSLIKVLLLNDDIIIGGINIAQEEYTGYSKEYYITLSDDLTLDVTPAHNGKLYLNAEPDIMLIHGDASSSIIRNIDDDIYREIYIGSEIDDDEMLESESDEMLDLIFDNAKVVKNKKGEPTGIAIDIGSILNSIFN